MGAAQCCPPAMACLASTSFVKTPKIQGQTPTDLITPAVTTPGARTRQTGGLSAPQNADFYPEVIFFGEDFVAVPAAPL